MSYVPLTETIHTSAPLRSRTQLRSAANSVSFSMAHITQSSVDLNAGALDPVRAGRPAHDVRAADNHLTRPGQSDARLAAPQHDLAIGGNRQLLSVDHNPLSLTGALDQAQQDWWSPASTSLQPWRDAEPVMA